MGFSNSAGSASFVNISKGRLAIKKGDEIVTFDSFEGQLTNIEILDDEYEGRKYKKLSLAMTDGVESIKLQMKLDSGYGRYFCNLIKNVDLSKPFRISPKAETLNGKTNTSLFIRQFDQPIKFYYSKTDPKGRPDLDKITFKGEEAWDNTKQVAFFTNMLMNEIKPQLQHEVLAGPATSVPNHIPHANEITTPLDDLPF